METWGELKSFLLKIMLPAFAAISIKLAVLRSKKPITILQVVVSFVCGIGFAYLLSDWVMSVCSPAQVPIAISVIAISGEKMGHSLVGIPVDRIINDIIKIIVERYRK